VTKEKLRFFSFLGKFGGDERGTVLVQFTIYLVAIMGMIGLALDGGRLILVHNRLQDLADAAALAAAAQLDGAGDAMTRADTAARSLTTNTPTHWYDVTGATILSGTNGVQFYSSLDPDTTTTDPKTANYVKVTTGAWQVSPTFMAGAAALLGDAPTSNSTSGSAWAQGNGANGVVANCGVTQSFLCNPFEGTESHAGNANNFAHNASVGTMVQLVNGAGASGNWGLLQVPDENANPHNQAAFWDQPSLSGSCTTANSQGTTRTGNVAKFAYQGMNVRFDSPFGSGDDSLSAPIVIDGFRSAGGSGSNKLGGNNCNRLDPGTTWDSATGPCPNGANCNGIPVVPCFNATNFGGSNRATGGCGTTTFTQTDASATAYQNYQTACNLASTDGGYGSCPMPRDRTFTNNVGNGLNTTDLQAYWKNHHGTSSLPTGVNSRWTAYQCELGVGSFAGVSGCGPWTTWTSDSAEPHGPVCTNSTVPTGATAQASRRILNVAVVDCSYWGITGNKPLPTSSLIAQFFMTEPAGQGTTTPSSNGMIHAEYVGCWTNNPASDPSGNCFRGSSAPSVLVNPGLFKNVQLVR
jgi:Flp pilus assembly protein TadG